MSVLYSVTARESYAEHRLQEAECKQMEDAVGFGYTDGVRCASLLLPIHHLKSSCPSLQFLDHFTYFVQPNQAGDLPIESGLHSGQHTEIHIYSRNFSPGVCFGRGLQVREAAFVRDVRVLERRGIIFLRGKMLPLLAAVAGAEAVVVFLLASNVTPLVTLGQNAVDACRGNKGARVIAKTVTGAFVVRLASDLSSTLRLQSRMQRTSGAPVVADQSLARSQMLEITLICFVLILELVLSSLDLSTKRSEGLKREVGTLKKQLKGAEAAYVRLQDEVSLRAAKEDKALAGEVKSQKEIIFDLRQKLEQAQVDVNSKEKELKSATTNLKALEKQTEGFQNEYTRVIDDNENLRIQLSLFDRKYASSGNKKNS